MFMEEAELSLPGHSRSTLGMPQVWRTWPLKLGKAAGFEKTGHGPVQLRDWKAQDSWPCVRIRTQLRLSWDLCYRNRRH